MNNIATASLQTKGSILTNSRCPPRSQMEKVISVFRIEMVFSMKLTPVSSAIDVRETHAVFRTQCLNVVLIPATFHVFDHQTGFPNLRIAHHADFDDHAALRGTVACLVGRSLVPVLVCLRGVV